MIAACLFSALKVKLMVRRPITTLVEQGILPSPKTSPALHEQKQRLERAKMQDMLRSVHNPESIFINSVFDVTQKRLNLLF
jgi:hypothetical protein